MENQERKIHLKIKIKSLADEARTIRAEARKVKGMARHRLNEHRTGVVRTEARHSLLAYGILRGMLYERMEKKCEEIPNWTKVTDMAKRFGANLDDTGIWIAAAKEYIKSQKE